MSERQELLEPVRNIEMTSRPHSDCDRHIPKVGRLAKPRIGTNKDGPRRYTVTVRNNQPHSSACIADRSPQTRALDNLLADSLVLRTFEVLHSLPTGLSAAKR